MHHYRSSRSSCQARQQPSFLQQHQMPMPTPAGQKSEEDDKYLHSGELSSFGHFWTKTCNLLQSTFAIHHRKKRSNGFKGVTASIGIS